MLIYTVPVRVSKIKNLLKKGKLWYIVLWEVVGSRPKLKCTNTTTKNDNLYRSTYIVYLEVIWPSLFWLKLLSWCLMCVSKGDSLSELFKYKFNYNVWGRDCTRIYAEKWLKDILLWGKCQLQANVSVHKFLNSD